MKERVVPLKNYIILFFICLITIFVSLYLISKYREVLRDIDNEKMVLSSVLYSVKIEELDNYLLDNPNIMIYLYNQNIDSKFEGELKDYLIEKQLKDDMVVINVSKFKKNEYKKLEKLYSGNVLEKNPDTLNYNNVIVVSERKINDMLYYQRKNITISDIDKFLLKHGVSND